MIQSLWKPVSQLLIMLSTYVPYYQANLHLGITLKKWNLHSKGNLPINVYCGFVLKCQKEKQPRSFSTSEILLSNKNNFDESQRHCAKLKTPVSVSYALLESLYKSFSIRKLQWWRTNSLVVAKNQGQGEDDYVMIAGTESGVYPIVMVMILKFINLWNRKGQQLLYVLFL